MFRLTKQQRRTHSSRIRTARLLIVGGPGGVQGGMCRTVCPRGVFWGVCMQGVVRPGVCVRGRCLDPEADTPLGQND